MEHGPFEDAFAMNNWWYCIAMLVYESATSKMTSSVVVPNVRNLNSGLIITVSHTSTFGMTLRCSASAMGKGKNSEAFSEMFGLFAERWQDWCYSSVEAAIFLKPFRTDWCCEKVKAPNDEVEGLES